MSGSVQFLEPAATPPNGYILIGSMDLILTQPDGKNRRVVTKVNVYMKQ